MADNFQVDLRGIVEILSRHLYSSPRVFVRELLQNGVDALTARRQLDPTWGGQLTITAHDDGSVTFADDGIGLNAAEVRDLLATIGRSSKRDQFDMQRDGFLGQFGIGLLSCFLVSDTIDVRTRSAREPDAPTCRWQAQGDGTYTLTDSNTDTDTDPLPAPGTVVTLRSRRGEHWLQPDPVRDLAIHYGALLPLPITFVAGGRSHRVAPQPAPWDLTGPEAADYCQRTFGFSPMATIPLRIPVAGVDGVAFVLPTPANPGEGSKHRVYLRRMLLGTAVPGLLPEWASFVRVVADVVDLRPTASREALYDDATLGAARHELGRQFQRWMVTTHATDPALLQTFIRVHRTAVSVAALRHDEVLALAREFLTWSTTTGPASFQAVRRNSPVVRLATDTKSYEALAGIAAARGVQVVNAGYAFGLDLLRRFAEVDPSIELVPVTVTDLVDRDGEPDDGLGPVVRIGSDALDRFACAVAARPFQPASCPALYVIDPERASRARDAHRRATVDADPLLAGLLGDPDRERAGPDGNRWADGDDGEYGDGEPPPFDTLVLNTLNPLIVSLTDRDPGVVHGVIGHLYITALTSGRTPGPDDHQRFTDSLMTLLERIG